MTADGPPSPPQRRDDRIYAKNSLVPGLVYAPRPGMRVAAKLVSILTRQKDQIQDFARPEDRHE
jgi:hypothetical protein